jgi:hypothetical protein
MDLPAIAVLIFAALMAVMFALWIYFEWGE